MWLPPRTTLGAPITTASPAAARLSDRLLRSGEIGKAAAQGPVGAALLGRAVVVGGDRDAGAPGCGDHGRNGTFHLGPTSRERVKERPVGFEIDAAPPGERLDRDRAIARGVEAWKVVVDRNEVDPAALDPADRGRNRIERHRLETEMDAMVDGEAVAHAVKGVEHPVHRIGAAEPAFPGARETQERGGDAVRGELPVGVGESDLDRNADAGAGHQLMLDGVAVEVDDSGEQHPPAGRFWRAVDVDRGDPTVLDQQAAFVEGPVGREDAVRDDFQGHEGLR